MSDAVKDLRRGVFWVHDAVIDEMLPAIGPDGLLVYTLLARRADKDGKSFPSLASIATGFGWGKNRVLTAVAALKAAGMVAVEGQRQGQRQGSNLYQLLDPSQWVRVSGQNPEPAPESPARTLKPVSESQPESLGTEPEGIHSSKGTTKKLSSRVAADPAAKESRGRMWDAVARAHYGTPPARYTQGEAADLGKTVKELLEVEAVPADVGRFKVWWDRKYRGAPFTHRCLRQHWGTYCAEEGVGVDADHPASLKSVAELAEKAGKSVAEVWALIQAKGLTDQYAKPAGLA